MSKPRADEKLWVYLVTFEVTISAVLIQQEKDEKYLMYYISYLFKGVVLHCTDLEKLTMRLTLATQQLHSYFLSHSSVVLIETLLCRVLSRPEAIGRLIKWATEMS